MKKAYFIGIGGIGISSLARYYLSENFEVFGSDLAPSETTEELEQEGVHLFIGPQKPEHLPKDLSIVVYSAAVPVHNPERARAVELQKENPHLKILSYPQALGEISQRYFTIAISGTHGKSTTVAMTNLILSEAGLDPTVFAGTKLKELNGKNFHRGKSRYLILEADEWQASFLNYYPQVLVITNLEAEHLDFYRNLDDILATYQKFINHLSRQGTLILNGDTPIFQKLKPRQDIKVRKYSLRDPVAKKIAQIIKVPGDYNLYNALASFQVGQTLGIEESSILTALGKYQGCWRRFDERKGRLGHRSFDLIYDYAHHPTALRAVLEALRKKFPEKKIIAVFQPHQYDRTFKLQEQFIQAFQEAPRWVNQLIITDIYEVAGRETEKKITAKELIEKTQNPGVIFQPLKNLAAYLENHPSEVVALIGAGNIYEWGRKTLEKK